MAIPATSERPSEARLRVRPSSSPAPAPPAAAPRPGPAASPAGRPTAQHQAAVGARDETGQIRASPSLCHLEIHRCGGGETLAGIRLPADWAVELREPGQAAREAATRQARRNAAPFALSSVAWHPTTSNPSLADPSRPAGHSRRHARVLVELQIISGQESECILGQSASDGPESTVVHFHVGPTLMVTPAKVTRSRRSTPENADDDVSSRLTNRAECRHC